jgi:hypothetical protein
MGAHVGLHERLAVGRKTARLRQGLGQVRPVANPLAYAGAHVLMARSNDHLLRRKADTCQEGSGVFAGPKMGWLPPSPDGIAMCQ